MIYPTSKTERLERETFEHPGTEYRGAPFWSWNCHVTKELVEEQIPIFKEMGMGGVTAHPRVGLDLEYMGEEFLERVKDACRIAKEQGMRVVLYDEDNFPSGNAGGLVTIHPQYRSRYLRMTRNVLPVYCQETHAGYAVDRAAYGRALSNGDEPDGYYICSYRVVLKDGYLDSYQKLQGPLQEETSGIWNLYLCVDPWKDGKIPYVDTMNPEAVKEFLNVTHERYAKALGDDFGKTAFAIFTDEPRLHNRNLLPYPEYEGDTTLAYTDDFSETFAKEYGTPFTDILPEVLWELPNQQVSYYRYAYNDHLAERFARAYSDQLGDWCEAHGIASTGHLLSERTLFQQTYRLSEAMRQYRSYQLPGIDILCGDLEFSTAKQAVSVARQLGREGVTSELYGVTNWNHTFKGHKLQGDWQAALGVTLRVHHLSYMSMAGEGKRDWPASIFYQSPWYRRYSEIEDHFARVNTALTRGKALVRVGVIHPVESYWLYLGNNAQTQEIREQMDADFEDLIRTLIYHTIDFDFLCESLLPDEVAQEWYETDSADAGKKLPVGKMEYDVVLVPDLKTIRGTTLRILERFAANGGTVIFAGDIPHLVDARPSERGEAIAKRCVCVPFQKYAILNALESFREVRIKTPQGSLSSDLLTQLRTDGEKRWLFVCHVEDKTDNVDRKEVRRIEVKGSWNPVLYDTWTGEIRELPAEVKDGWTRILVTLYAQDSVLLCLEPGKPAKEQSTEFTGEFRIVPVWQQTKASRMPLRRMPQVRLSEPNVLLLDTPSFRFDDREWNNPAYCLNIETDYKKRLHISNMQPYRQKDTAPRGFLSLRYEIESGTDSEEIRASEERYGSLIEPSENNKRYFGGDVELAFEYQEGAKIFWNGEAVNESEPVFTGYFTDAFIRTIALGKLKKGVNTLEIRYPFGAKSMVEPCYLLGDFSVRLAGARATLSAPLTELAYGDAAVQGLPFYTGNITYMHRFAVDEEAEWELELPYFEAPALDVSVDGQPPRLLAFAPHCVSLGVLKEGGHSIAITSYGNRYNCFAPLHNADRNYKWYGPASFRTSGYQWTNEYRIRQNGILDCPKLRRV